MNAASIAGCALESPCDRCRGVEHIAPTVALLTGGQDKPYAHGMAAALSERGLGIDFVGSDDVDGPAVHGKREIRFLNLRGSQRTDVSKAAKILRVLKFYLRLLIYTARSQAPVFHVLWNEKFELFDRTALMLFYRLCGRRVVFTAHNVNTRKRDNKDSFLNRLTLRIQYSLVQKIFVHTQKMKDELMTDFGVSAEKAVLIPFGINNTLPNTALTFAEARAALGIGPEEKVLLFFGRITPYKGLDLLVEALALLRERHPEYRLLVAGPIKHTDEFYLRVQEVIKRTGTQGAILQHIGFVPDEKVEQYFKAGDLFVLPYLDVFQSGVLFLGYSFGLPVVVTDVGSLREDVVEGKTGFVCEPRNPKALAASIEQYFGSEIFRELAQRRADIRAYANERYSWTKVAEITQHTYAELIAR
ncbi:MAG: hypothetical protein RLY20_902 [Verrucomicrobiota bacterium]|jgi:glycosyltransferase involved in cell wall biosynthesis